MNKKHVYTSKKPDDTGYIDYGAVDDGTWKTLFERQTKHIIGRACPEFIAGIEELKFSSERIPQHKEVTAELSRHYGWGVEQVAALIPATEFFTLLSNKKFPAASFIRLPEELDYLMEPDIFHEFFGHCPLLTNKAYSNFMYEFGKIALAAKPKDRVQLFRLFWFTIEFGLIQTTQGLRAYGGGILSSFGETTYALESKIPMRKPFDPVDVLRTPFRIDILQPIYFVIQSYDQLFEIIDMDLMALLQKARELGDHPPMFEPKK
ncbi:MAG: phenylalanine 4-monooxygenase [Bacteriovoracaceae bacterium]|nr:phenylalanine 4-monooxygenase [Bacteriovoracaceae bacterium]